MSRHDIQQLKDRLPLVDLIGDVVQLKKHGKEFKGLCPFHKEKTPSFAVFNKAGRDAFYCAGCGAGGDHVQFLQDYYQLDTREAIDRFAELAGGGSLAANDNAQQRASKRTEKPVQDWQPAIAPADQPAPSMLWASREGDWVELPVVAAWPYRDQQGQLHGYTCRVEFDKPDGSRGKDVIPVTWKANTETGEQKWRQGALPEPRLLYGAELLLADQEANIVLVEGEKAADAARRLLADFPVLVLTWPGGCKAVDKADWSMLAGRKVVGWPDCDSQCYADNQPQAGQLKPYHEQPGMAAMLRIAEILEQHGASMRIVAVPKPGAEWPNGHDLADLEAEGWSGDQVMQYLRERLHVPAEIIPQVEHHDNDNQPPADWPEYELEDYNQGPGPEIDSDPEPIRPVGWDRGVGYYLSVADGQLHALTATQHSKPYFMAMAPLHFWAQRFTDESSKQRKIDWDLAAEAMIRSAQRQGIFDPDRLRGRGAWWDKGQAVVHIGDSLVVDGVQSTLDEVRSHFIYERSLPIRINTDNPLPSSEAMKLYDICARLSFADPIGPKLLAGWVFLAPICGALQWRPHIWITGPSGSGKSTIIDKDGIVGRALGSFKLSVLGDTSEAGIRQKLKQDGLPIVFDEFENDTEKAARKVQDVMALVTQASSDTGAKILKGSATGKVEAFQIRSMFAFASVNISLRQHAARTRVTVLEMVQKEQTPESREHYRQTKRMIVETLTPEYVDRLHARAVRMIPVIRQNAETFAEAASITLNGRRFGDQVGTLLAGLYALHKEGLVSLEAAEKYIREQEWEDVKEVRETSDHDSCLKTIVTKQLRVESSIGVRTYSIGELIMLCMGRSQSDATVAVAQIQQHEAADTLRRHGVIVHRVNPGKYTVRIANDHPEMCKLLGGTVWADSYKKTLSRLPGAKKLDPMKFGATTARGIELPDSLFD